ncbi:hypothetical protein Pfo_028127 [Paulownia fortunei]|nr:hypothetical protein Pfo_028127 [Paulownia fortunei]
MNDKGISIRLIARIINLPANTSIMWSSPVAPVLSFVKDTLFMYLVSLQLGNTYTTVLADAAARYHRLLGDDVYFFKQLMDISYDDFIRTTEDRHEKAVEKIFTQLLEDGDIYKGEYEVGILFQMKNISPNHNLLKSITTNTDYYKTHPNFIQPEARMNEMINNFIAPGLEDLAVTRTSFDWGVPVLGMKSM